MTTAPGSDPLLRTIGAILGSCATSDARLPRTQLFNEGWMLRVLLEWASSRGVAAGWTDRRFVPADAEARWMSEVGLPTAFVRRMDIDRLAESTSYADGAVGHFDGGWPRWLALRAGATQLSVIEAKIGSGLSKRTTNAPDWNQAARAVACIAQVLRLAHRLPESVPHLAFTVLAPVAMIKRAGTFLEFMDPAHIRARVVGRIAQYTTAPDRQPEASNHEVWLGEWLAPTLAHIRLAVVPWEDLISQVDAMDEVTGRALERFYGECLRLNRISS